MHRLHGIRTVVIYLQDTYARDLDTRRLASGEYAGMLTILPALVDRRLIKPCWLYSTFTHVPAPVEIRRIFAVILVVICLNECGSEKFAKFFR